MTDSHPEPPPRPTSKQLRDARREAHAAQKNSGKKSNDKKGKMGKGDSKP